MHHGGLYSRNSKSHSSHPHAHPHSHAAVLSLPSSSDSPALNGSAGRGNQAAAQALRAQLAAGKGGARAADGAAEDQVMPSPKTPRKDGDSSPTDVKMAEEVSELVCGIYVRVTSGKCVPARIGVCVCV